MSPELASAKSSILDSKEADAAREVIARWVHGFYANLNYWAERGYVDDRITEMDPVGPDWPDDNADDVEPEQPVYEHDGFGR